ncbi:lipoprotein [Flavobacterium coralii]|uniref:lipoprotein n=1 Tax=Flavobacterium coralii TaxID=2838017 RepID=UPI000C45AE83|nr:hypothetical protein [Flavobacterium sp.]|tara:strand:+ start:5699 stop:6130 length:432 start_codon:yes stop_codon:yes gene_type:complete
MKKLLLLLVLVAGLSACSLEEDTPQFEVAFLPVESLELPESMVPGHTYPIKIYYKRPDDCHYFDGFYTEKANDSEILAVQALVIQDAKCKSLESEEAEWAMYDFTCPNNLDITQYSAYSFQIFKGVDSQGNRIFETVSVPVGE